MPISGINISYGNSGIIGVEDADIFVDPEGGRRPTTVRQEPAREAAGAFPGATFSFLPADIVSQILNFGAPAPLDVQIVGRRNRRRTRLRQHAARKKDGGFRASPIRASRKPRSCPRCASIFIARWRASRND